MAGEIFYWVLNTSILGTAAGLILLLLRKLRSLPRFGVYVLWLLPLLRFWMPAGIANQYSLLNFISRYTTRTVILQIPFFETRSLTVSNSIQAATQYFPMEFKTDLLANIFAVAGLVWAVVAAAAILCSLILYFLTKSALHGAEHLRENIYTSDKVLSPAVYGIFRPRIILPGNLPEKHLRYILLHERIHIRRRDNLWRVVAVVTVCVHWFNPLVWIFLRFLFTDMEMACDAGVLKKIENNEKRSYASALLACASGKTYYASAFGGAKTRLRVENILSYKKLTLLSGVCFAILFLVIAVTVLTNAVA